MKSRTRSRKPASIGSNHSSRRPTAISPSEPRTGNFVLLLVMAWSPPAHNAGSFGFQHPETTPPSIPTTLRTAPWALLYIDRWLKAPMQMADGSLIGRERGTPQGGVISPLLANLFLHYAFDLWMRRNFPDILFERYADDAICHCRDEDQATALRTALATRFAECGLTLHPEKTKIVYCKDQSRRENHPTFKFDFLGYTFRPRMVGKRVGGMGVSFSPAASTKALTAIRRTIRSWSMHRRSDKGLDDLARMFNSHIRGWINYYGRFCPSALYPTLQRIDLTLARWASGKFKSLRGHKRRSRHWLARIARHQPRLFAHWGLLYGRGRTMGAG